MKSPVTSEQIQHAHQLYCHWTGQTLPLGYGRERMWYDLLRLGYGPEQIRQVVIYLQREIRQGRRNVGALKLSNLLQPDRFEEDLNISRVRLKASRLPERTPAPPLSTISPEAQAEGRTKALKRLQELKAQLRSRE